MVSSQSDIHAVIKQETASVSANGMYRVRRVIESAQGPTIRLNGKEVINFCSNDYLGFANHPQIVKAFKEGVDKYGVGSGASQLVCGYTSAHRLLEEKLAAFTNRDRAVIFSSGYMANQAIINSLLNKSDMVFGDRLNHASMVDAALISRASFKRFQHADPVSLESILKNAGEVKKMVVTDAVFSMDGDIAPLDKYVEICERQNAWLVVDDAHGFGVLGNKGAGTLEQYSLSSKQVPLLMATFGKALGTFGAFVAGDEDIIEYLIQTARTLIYSTAPPPAVALATISALDLMQEENWRRKKLEELINYFRKGAKKAGLPVNDSETAIQPLIIGDANKATKACEKLLQKGIYVQAIRPPTVPKGTSRFRITLTAAHEQEQVDRLLAALQELF